MTQQTVQPGFNTNGRPALPGTACTVLGILLLWGIMAVPASAQEPEPVTEPATAASDSTESSAGPEGGDLNEGLRPGLSAANMAAIQGANSQSVSVNQQSDLPFFLDFTHSAKAGIKSDVRVNKYYGELASTLSMARNSRATSNFSYSWDDFRQQNKTVETLGEKLMYTSGEHLPFRMTTNGSWDWSEDKTVNAAGYSNLSKRDFKRGSVQLSKPKFDLGAFKAVLNSSVGMNDQKSVTRGQRNNTSEANLAGGAQLGTELSQGLTMATRVYGKTASGDRSLGDNSAPSSASGDTVGVGVYFDRNFGNGRLTISRSNFDKKYLDYKRNSTGQIDTVGLDEFDKIIDELESNDAVSIEFENEVKLGRLGLKSSLSRDTDELAYSASGVGKRERQTDEARFGVTFGTRRDSFALSYSYLWKWDDQRIKNATANRGRQITKNRDVDFYYGRRLFHATRLSLKMHQGLGQDIAQNQFNTNDKDRLRNDVALEVTRDWPGKFKADMLFAYKQNEEIAIRSTRSSNNNIKDSFEISPGFNWYIADWLTFNQSYRVYIQYTDYIYSDLEEVSREDNYNKRGNLNTIVVIEPTERLEIAIRHDYNKRSNATRAATDATGNSFYRTAQDQAINKIDFGLVFRMVEGVSLEAATYRTRDFKTSYGSSIRESEVYSGQVWVGAKVNRKWGKQNPLELSALVKKFNAYGSSVTEASSDYWEADIWLKWDF